MTSVPRLSGGGFDFFKETSETPFRQRRWAGRPPRKCKTAYGKSGSGGGQRTILLGTRPRPGAVLNPYRPWAPLAKTEVTAL